MPITYSNGNVNNGVWISADDVLNFLFIGIIIIIIIVGVIKNVKTKIANLIRDFWSY